MSEYNIYPAVDSNHNFPPVVRQALADSNEIKASVVQMTTEQVPPLVATAIAADSTIVAAAAAAVNANPAIADLIASKWVKPALLLNTNLDTITTPGQYNVLSNTVAASLTPTLPFGSAGGGSIIVEGGGNYISQTWKPAGASLTLNPTYKREKNNALWTDFHRMDDISPDKWNSMLLTRYDKGELAAGTDLNTIKAPGNYYIKNTANANTMIPALPLDARGGGALIVSGGVNGGVQAWHPGTANLSANPTYQREWNGLTFWTEFHKTGGLSPDEASQLSSVKPESINYAFQQTAQLAGSIARTMGGTQAPPWAYYGLLGTKQVVPGHISPEGGQTVHPSIVDIPAGWNGYRYWMGHTPYAGGSDAQEDPNIVASNDGTTWVIPDGLANPLDDQPGSPGAYNSDICLTMGPANTLYCFWRTFTPSDASAGEKLYVRTSTNGTTWTTRELVFATAIGDGLLSPSFQWDGTKWTMYAVAGGPSPNVLVRLTAAKTIPKPADWSARQNCDVGTLPDGKEPWHVEIQKYGEVWYGLLNDCTKNKAGLNGQIYLLKSTDGITFQNSGRAVIPQVGPDHDALYKATFIPKTSAGLDYFQVWYSAWDTKTITWNIFRTNITAPPPQPAPDTSLLGTGWRDVSAWLPDGAVGTLFVNRVGSEIRAVLKLSVIPTVQTSRNNAAVVGFRPAFNEFSELLIAYGNIVPITSFGVNTSGTITLFDPVNPTNGNLSAHFSWYTNDAWPATMPGIKL